MKAMLVGLLLLLICQAAQAQQAPASVEGTTVLAVLVADSGAVAWKRVEQIWSTRDFEVQVRDSTALYLQSKPYQHPLGFSVILQATVIGHTVLLSGYSLYGPFSPRPKPLWYSRYSHVSFSNFDYIAWGWKQMQAVAAALASKKTVYFWQPLPELR